MKGVSVCHFISVFIRRFYKNPIDLSSNLKKWTKDLNYFPYHFTHVPLAQFSVPTAPRKLTFVKKVE